MHPRPALIPFLLALSLACAPAPAPAAPLNVFVLVMDTTRADRCSFNGYTRPTTPRLEAFATHATVYTDAWSPAGWTGPAHASLFTGLRPEHHGLDHGRRRFLGDERVTMAQRLHAAGYATGCFSNNMIVSPDFGLVRGFDVFAPLYRDEARQYPWAHETHERAAGWAETVHASGRPFFLFVNDMEPHLPYTPPAAFATAFLRADATPAEIAALAGFEVPRPVAHNAGVTRLTPRQLGIASDLYDAEIATLDQEVGTILDRLRDDGLLDSTIVVVAGDHGENFDEHGLVDHMASLHRSIRHVPLIVRVPGSLDHGARIESVVRLEDVLPTILEACGLAPAAGIDGVSLLHDLDGRISRASQAPSPEIQGVVENLFPGCDCARLTCGIESVYDGKTHYLRWSDGREAAYDIGKDPGEASDLAPTRPRLAARMRRLLDDAK